MQSSYSNLVSLAFMGILE